MLSIKILNFINFILSFLVNHLFFNILIKVILNIKVIFLVLISYYHMKKIFLIFNLNIRLKINNLCRNLSNIFGVSKHKSNTQIICKPCTNISNFFDDGRDGVPNQLNVIHQLNKCVVMGGYSQFIILLNLNPVLMRAQTFIDMCSK